MCEYCKMISIPFVGKAALKDFAYTKLEPQSSMRIIKPRDIYVIHSENGGYEDTEVDSLPIKYCPMCGRNLK